MDDLPLQRIQISGPTLSSLLQRFSSSPGDLSGLLFGHISLSTPSPFSDDTPSTTPPSSSPAPTLTATITSFLSAPSSSSPFFFSPTAQITPPSLSSSLLGCFSARRKTPLRPSLRESSLTSSLSSSTTHNHTFPPSILLLLTTPFQDQSIYTHEYRAYQYRLSTHSFEPRTLDVVNLGPGFRSHYDSFFPNNSPFPMLQCGAKGEGEGLAASRRVSKDQKELDMCAEGFDMGRLGRLVGQDAAGYKGEIEELYRKMLDDMDGLARLVEESSARVLEQENHNMKLRYKVAGLE
ncbi:hypothetical protein RHSIM_Rhsim04G0125000 [Rhododendron simsii]|uniref:Uncharacterized protein n=1 Tax=Rhododendron simsii TaxID=118357 RepID=A0A834LRF0_RHOSS|nr:hypothetical protein RHSIM_Rhsim04G0125000 [Rhododendron simsii]